MLIRHGIEWVNCKTKEEFDAACERARNEPAPVIREFTLTVDEISNKKARPAAYVVAYKHLPKDLRW